MERLIHLVAVGSSLIGTTWRRARVETALLEEEWRYRRGLKSEVTKMEAARKAIEGLKLELARTIHTSPWAAEAAIALLNERLAAISPRQHVKTAASESEADADEERSV
jgi:hypothetical protein